jgi:hypothetical protein
MADAWRLNPEGGKATVKKQRRLIVILTVLAMALAAAPAASADGNHPGLTPDSVDEVVFPGQSVDIDKTVHTPEIPPMVEVCLLEDETGSFWDDIGNLQTPPTASDIYDNVVGVSPGARFAVAGFRDYPVAPHGSGGDWVYRLLSSMSSAKANWLNGIAALSASGGADTPEAQYDAIVAALGGGFDQDPCGFDPNPLVTRVLVVTTDAPFHLPGLGKPHVNTQPSTIAALSAANVTVVGLKAPGAGGELDALAAATGGNVQPLSSSGADIAAAILAGLGNLPVDVEMATDCAYPISVTFDPATQTVTSGDDAVFTETIAVSADAPGGTYTCEDWALIDGSPMVDERGAIIYETKTVKVPEGFLTGGGQTDKGKKALNFGGNVGFLADFSVVGQWQFRDGGQKLMMHSLSIDTLQFSNDAGPDPYPPPANAEVATFSGTSRVKLGTAQWDYGCSFTAQAHDHGEPDVADVFGIQITCGATTWTYGRLVLDTGNFQIHSGLKG